MQSGTGRRLTSFTASRLAPASRRARTASGWLCCAAKWRHVFRSCSHRTPVTVGDRPGRCSEAVTDRVLCSPVGSCIQKQLHERCVAIGSCRVESSALKLEIPQPLSRLDEPVCAPHGLRSPCPRPRCWLPRRAAPAPRTCGLFPPQNEEASSDTAASTSRCYFSQWTTKRQRGEQANAMNSIPHFQHERILPRSSAHSMEGIRASAFTNQRQRHFFMAPLGCNVKKGHLCIAISREQIAHQLGGKEAENGVGTWTTSISWME